MSRARIAAEKLIKLANDVDDELPHLTVMQAFKDVIEEAEERIFEATKAACMRLADKVDLRSGIAALNATTLNVALSRASRLVLMTGL